MKHVLLVAINSDEESVAYGLILQDSWMAWERGYIEEHINHRFSFMYGGSRHMSTWPTWEAVKQHLDDCNGTIAQVEGCIAF